MKRALTIAALAFALLAVVGALWTYQHRQLVSSRADAEAARLALKNQIVASGETKTALQGQVNDLLVKNGALAAAYAEALAAVPTAHPIGTASLDTGPLPVVIHKPSVVGEGLTGTAEPRAAVPVASCVLTHDDKLSIEVEQVTLQTDQGNLLIVGTAAAYTVDPKALLASGRFRSVLSDASALKAPAPPRWGALALAGCGVSGCGPGAALLLPPVSVLGLHVEGMAGALALPGALAVVAGAGVRW